MNKVTAIYCQKGGVGKSVTTQLLSIALAERGNRVLMIDLDSDAHLTNRCGFSSEDIPFENSIPYLLSQSIQNKQLPDNLPVVRFEGCDLITSNSQLAGIENELLNANDPFSLKRIVEPLKQKYEYIFIDCRPSLSNLSVAALTASDSVIIPIEPYDESVHGLLQTHETIALIRENLNPQLKVEGVLVNKFDRREGTAVRTVDFLQGQIPLFETMVPKSSLVGDSSSEGISLFRHRPRNPVAVAFRELAKEVMEHEQQLTEEEAGFVL